MENVGPVRMKMQYVLMQRLKELVGAKRVMRRKGRAVVRN